MQLALPGAVSLSRALLTLARSEQSGVLHVASSRERFQLVLHAGKVCALRCADVDQHALGDALMAIGALDCARYSEALARQTPRAPIGRWLVETGCTTSAALQYTLRRQLRERVKRMLVSSALDYHFDRCQPDAADSWLEAPYSVGDLVLFGLRELLAEREVEHDLSALPKGTLRLTGVGASLVYGAALWPEEQAVVELLRQGSDLRRIREAVRNADRGLRLLVLVHVLGALTVSDARRSQYALLLRKLRQARQAVDATALLELPSTATEEQARRALHRFAGSLHPDTLGPHAPDELRAASHEVMAALNAAERHLRHSGLRR